MAGSGSNGLTKSKEEAHHTDRSTTGGVKVLAWLRWTVGAQQVTEDLGCRLGNCEYCGLNLASILAKLGKEKSKIQLPSAWDTQEDQQNLLREFKSAGGFFPPSLLFSSPK